MFSYFKKESGSIMPMTAMALVSIMGMGSLVFDSSHIFVNKAKLQNLVDAAAIGSAKVLIDNRNQFLARIAAKNIITSNLNQAHYQSLSDLGLDANDFIIQFSATRNPFVSNPAATSFTRIRLKQNVIKLNTVFMGIFGIDEVSLSTSAVAGPSPGLGSVCNAIPTIICGDPNQPPDNSGMFGYQYGDSVTLAMGNVQNNDIGPGNYQLLDLGAGNDASLRENLAGGSDACITTGSTVETKPGINRGPISQGFNTRFGIYNGPVSATDYPPDLVTDAGSANYPDTYTDYLVDNMRRRYDEADGIAKRRVMPVPFGNCDGTINGQGSVDIMGFGCIFLNQPAENNASLQTVQLFGELVRNCRTTGMPGTSSENSNGVHSVVLYGDPSRWDS